MKEFNVLINETNDTRMKRYYNLSELVKITGMSTRALKYRMLDVKKKYKDVTSLLTKKDKQWRIHYSIVEEFQPKYHLKTKTIYNYRWQSMATWNPLYNYDTAYHVELVREIKRQLPDNVISYSVELDGRGVNHTHLISDAGTHELNEAVSSTLSKYIENQKELRMLVQPIINKFSAVDYLQKMPRTSGIL